VLSGLDEKTENIQDQATELRNHFHNDDQDDQDKIDVLNLPPRNEVHQDKKRTHIKWSKPFGRFLLVVMVLVILLFIVYYSFDEDLERVIFFL